MDITETAEAGLYEVKSESSSGKYIVDVRGKGIDGDPQTCTCTRYAINKNRAGGIGYQGEFCKHLREVTGGTATIQKSKAKTEAEETDAEFERIRVASSLQHILSDLEKQ